MSVIRAFIAIDLPAEIQKKLAQVTQHLQVNLKDVPVKWVPAGNIHLTLKFLGDVSLANYAMLTDLIEAEAAAHRAFEISIGGIGAYPNVRRPRVIWIGVEAPAELHAVQRSIEVQASRLGYPGEKRSYSPHLTVGRVSRNARPADVRAVSEVLKTDEVGFLGVARVDSIHLYRSDLRPGGAVYTKLYSAPLGAA